VVDGNPIYLLMQHFFAQYRILFDLGQVIEPANGDHVSKGFWPAQANH
jgi:hypothetical protein